MTLKPDAGPVTAADIIAFCRANMAHYKVPKTVVFGPLAKTSTGKIQKYALREQAEGDISLKSLTAENIAYWYLRLNGFPDS